MRRGTDLDIAEPLLVECLRVQISQKQENVTLSERSDVATQPFLPALGTVASSLILSSA